MESNIYWYVIPMALFVLFFKKVIGLMIIIPRLHKIYYRTYVKFCIESRIKNLECWSVVILETLVSRSLAMIRFRPGIWDGPCFLFMMGHLWLKKVYFIHLLMALIQCTCAVLEKARLLRQWSCMSFLGLPRIPYAIYSLKMANLSLSWFSSFLGGIISSNL